ncbi:hypothetical protein WJX72_002485 [[Myrmecia] bisecta]|uniref:Uncharacterized protein n=1 Tax=[Myrmecia] bisecta TaxID=41462 RepID=A0AAW1PSF0_9CHLO
MDDESIVYLSTKASISPASPFSTLSGTPLGRAPRDWRTDAAAGYPVLETGQIEITGDLFERASRFLVDNERLLIVAASTLLCSISHTALRPVLPVFAKSP